MFSVLLCILLCGSALVGVVINKVDDLIAGTHRYQRFVVGDNTNNGG